MPATCRTDVKVSKLIFALIFTLQDKCFSFAHKTTKEKNYSMNNHAKSSNALQMRQNTGENTLVALYGLYAFPGLMRDAAMEEVVCLAGRENDLPRPRDAGRPSHGSRAFPHLDRLSL